MLYNTDTAYGIGMTMDVLELVLFTEHSSVLKRPPLEHIRHLTFEYKIKK